MGYLCLFEDKDKLHDNDIKEILNLLTVSELHDILCKLKKVFTFIDISIRICILILTQLMLHPLFRYILWWKDYFVINMFRMHYVVHMFISFSIMHCFISTSFWTLSKNLHVSNIILLFKTQ